MERSRINSRDTEFICTVWLMALDLHFAVSALLPLVCEAAGSCQISNIVAGRILYRCAPLLSVRYTRILSVENPGPPTDPAGGWNFTGNRTKFRRDLPTSACLLTK